MNINCSVAACPVILNSTCVFYEGANLIYTGINTNDSIQVALQKIDLAVSNRVDNVYAIAPLYSTGGNNPVLSITQSSASIDGYLSSIDWNIFNNKQNAITLTTVGSTGASTFNGLSGALNIPDYSGSFSGFVPTSRLLTINGVAQDLSANRTWNVGTVTSVDMSVPTGFSISGNPITGSGTFAVTFASGYSLPTNTSQSNWDTAYSNRITSLTTAGSSGASTLISNVLNIPNYTLSGLGGVPSSRTLTINGVAFDLSADRSWSVGTVTSIGTSGPITGGTITGSGTIGITQSSGSTDGYLSSADWTAFNGKQPQLNGTGFVKASGTTISYDNSTYYLASNPSAFIALTSLSSGTGISYNNLTGVITNSAPDQVVTLTQGGTTVISGTYPNFTITSSDQFVGTVTSVAALTLGTTGTDLSSSVATGTTTPVITLNVPTASAANRGVLSSADWTTFNSKQAALTLTTTGSSGAATLVGATLNIPQYSGTNIYNADGTLTAARTLTHGGYNLSLVGSTHTNRFTAAGRLLLGTTTESTYLLDNFGSTRLGSLTISTGTATAEIIINNTSNITYINSSNVAFRPSGAGYVGRIASTGWTFGSFTQNNGNKIWFNYGNEFNNNNDLIYIQGGQSNNNGNPVAYINNILNINPTINNNGGNSINTFRGIYYNPITTALLNTTHIFLQSTSGDVLLGTTSGSVGIGSNTSINTSAILDITSTTKGFLPPRLSTAQRDAIATPATGLQVYNTTTNANNYYDGSAWVAGGTAITLSAIGSTPNANAATLTGSALNLEPASASFGGVVTTGTQTFAGAKTFNSTVDVTSNLSTTGILTADFTSTGLTGGANLYGASVITRPTVNSGVTWGGGNVFFNEQGILQPTFSGSATFETSNYVSQELKINRITFAAASSTITMNQTTGIRAYSNAITHNYIDGTNNGTITHFANIAMYGDYAASTARFTFTNRYGLLINDFQEFSQGHTYTNRWAIYQDGADDNNYFKGKVVIGSTNTVGASPLNVKNLPTSAAGLATGDIWNNSGVLNIV